MASFEHLEEMVTGLYDRGKELPVNRQVISIGNWVILKSGLYSPYLINMRPALSLDAQSQVSVDNQRRHRTMLLDAFGEKIDIVRAERPFHHLFGSPEAGTPLAAAIAEHTGDSLLWKRVVNKSDRGAHELLEGAWLPGQRVVRIDDVVTTAKTKEEDAAFFEETGLVYDDVVVGVDRQQGGRQTLEAQGQHLSSVVEVTQIFDILHDAGRLNAAQYEYLLEYPAMPPITQQPQQHPWQ